MEGSGTTTVSAWAEDLFGDDAEDMMANSEQIIEDHGISLHISMVIPVNSAKDWLEHWNAAVHGSDEAMAKMFMFLEQIATQIEEGLEMPVGEQTEMEVEDPEEWGFN